ncbi:MAG: hypothetical protein D6677_07405 [Calditrichaeota bacterium]|nr:MAG: hypothetical protein D6677_07405 [Calditrichota bacterium]
MMKALWQISRPLNVFIAFLSVFFSAWLVVDDPFTVLIIRTALSAALVTAAANVINDIFDLDIDRVNKPHRPLPAGRLSVSRAWWFYNGLNLLALILVIDQPALLSIAAGSAWLLYLYSKTLKRLPFGGNLLVAVISGVAFLYGALAAGDVSAACFPALFAALFHLARELIKDLEDVDGDRQYGARTLAVQYGRTTVLKMVDAVFIILFSLLWLPFLVGLYNIYYIYMVMPGVAGVLLWCALSLHQNSSVHNLARISMILKIDMLIGLVSIYAGVKL